jgi:phytoene desaturase
MWTLDGPRSRASATQRTARALVIGSGFGGLAAAIRLAARGYRVTVLEKLDAPGGRAYVQREGGFTFDSGPTIVTLPRAFEELWALCGQRMADHIDLRPMNPFYNVRFNDGSVFAYRGDRESSIAEIERFSPGESKNYDRFIALSEEIYRKGYEELGEKPFNSILDMLRVAPDILRLQGLRSVYGLVSRYFKDPRLRFIFSFHPLFIGGNPFQASGIFAMISYLEKTYGVWAPMGGTASLVNGLVRLIEGQGTEIRYRAEVSQILIENGIAKGVELKSGERLDADIVVSNADAAFTYKNLVAKKWRWRWGDLRLGLSKYSMGLFVWYFGVNRRYDDLAHHTIMVGPRYREHLTDIFDRKILSEDFSLYLYRPTATDPSLAPPGCDTFYVLSPVPNLQGGQDWAKEAEPYRQRIAAWLEANVLPDLSKHVVVSRVTTPVDFRDRLLSPHGAGFSLQPLLSQSAWFRPHNRSEDVENLFLVGAGTHPGAGLPAVLASAAILDKVAPDASVFV